jgi:hypothetical protein
LVFAAAFALSCPMGPYAAAPDMITLNEDGPFEGFTAYAEMLKGIPFFYATCLAERGPDYLIVPTVSSINIALIESHAETGSDAATVINNATLESSNGEFEVVDSEGGIGTRIQVGIIANFLRTEAFNLSATGELRRLKAPGVRCP